MKITYFINQYPMVSHSFIRREILALEKQGYTIQRISLRGWNVDTVNKEDENEKSLTKYVLKDGVIPLLIGCLKTIFISPVKFLHALNLSFKINKASDRSLPFHLISLAEACYILPLMKKFHSQHAHAHFGTNSAEVIMLANALGGPNYSFTVHGPEEYDKPIGLHLKEKIERAKFVVAISSFGRSQLYRWIDKSQWSKVKVVRCGLEKTFYDIKPVPIPEIPQLVCVGRLCEQKGQLLLIDACNILNLKSIDFKLVLAGDGDLRIDIETLLQKYQLQDKVRITGWISSEEVRGELLSSRGMILPSFAEGLPVVIMEALSLKRPVLTTFIAGIPELIENGKTGWLFPAGDVLEIANAIERFLLVKTTELESISDLAYNKVLQNHDVDIESSKLSVFIKSSIENIRN